MVVSGENDPKLLLKTLRGERTGRLPIWMMRQAGRYLPEYRQLRQKVSTFLDMCYTSDYAIQVTLQPIWRFGFDAAILFSDILVIPDALGQKVVFEEGKGPRLEPITNITEFNKIATELDLDHLAPIFETIKGVKSQLPPQVALIGFCGAPWTVASYMVSGQGTADQAPVRSFAYRDPDLFGRLIDRLTDASIVYLRQQIKAGVEVVQIFESLALHLPLSEFHRWCLTPIKRIISVLTEESPQIPIIVFARAADAHLRDLAEIAHPTGLGLPTITSLHWGERFLPRSCVLQGNLDPLVLSAGGRALDEAIDDICNSLRERAHIFNLGHGVVPETPLQNVEHLLKRLR